MSKHKVLDNEKSVYLYIIQKQSIKDYTTIEMPAYYDGTIRDESKMGYTVLKQILRTRFNMLYDPRDMQATPDGKPFMISNALSFSISNCQDYIACTVGYQELGVDIEQPRQIQPKLLQKILTPQEIKNSVNPLMAWVIKEAYGKYLGTGLKLGFTSVNVEDLLSQQPSLVLNDGPYYCALFYTNPKTTVQVEYSLEGSK